MYCSSAYNLDLKWSWNTNPGITQWWFSKIVTNAILTSNSVFRMDCSKPTHSPPKIHAGQPSDDSPGLAPMPSRILVLTKNSVFTVVNQIEIGNLYWIQPTSHPISHPKSVLGNPMIILNDQHQCHLGKRTKASKDEKSTNLYLKVNKQKENVMPIITISIFKLPCLIKVAQYLKCNKMVSFLIEY